MTLAYHRHHGLEVRIVRIFNTYGPRMRAHDGRVVSNFLVQALRGEPLTVYGDGKQTRSFCYVDDEVRGFLALLDGDRTGPDQHRQPRRVHHARVGRPREGGHRLGVRDRLRTAARRRPHAAPARHHPGPRASRLGAAASSCGRASSARPPTSAPTSAPSGRSRVRVAVTLEQCWHRVPGGTATSILGLVASLAGDDEPRAGRRRRPPRVPTRLRRSAPRSRCGTCRFRGSRSTRHGTRRVRCAGRRSSGPRAPSTSCTPPRSPCRRPAARPSS